jgi:hypothetical protein
MQVFVRDHCTMIAAPVQCDIDGIPKGSHCALLIVSLGNEDGVTLDRDHERGEVAVRAAPRIPSRYRSSRAKRQSTVGRTLAPRPLRGQAARR